jgi:hypothetical protein
MPDEVEVIIDRISNGWLIKSRTTGWPITLETDLRPTYFDNRDKAFDFAKSILTGIQERGRRGGER